jgi:hypothetical protein
MAYATIEVNLDEFDDDDAVVRNQGNDIFFNDGSFHVFGFLWGGGVGFRRMCGKSA